jgi:hypothetical protein
VQEYAFTQAAAGKKPGEDEDHWAVLVPNALLALESPFLTLLMLLAFPLRELEAPPPAPPSASSAAGGGGSLDEPSVSSPLLHSLPSPPSRGRRAGAAGGSAGAGEGAGAAAEGEEEMEMGVGDLLFTRRGESLGAEGGGPAARVPSSTEYII